MRGGQGSRSRSRLSRFSERRRAMASNGKSGFGKFFYKRAHSVTEVMMRDALDSLNRDSRKKLFQVRAIMPDGTRRLLYGEDGMCVQDLMTEVTLEYRLNVYEVSLTHSQSCVSLNMDAHLLDNQEIQITPVEDADVDPRIAKDQRLSVVYDMLRAEEIYQDSLRSIFDIYAEPLRKFSSLSKDDHRVFFFGLEPLLSLSTMLVLKLQVVIEEWDPGITRIGSLFSKQFWRQYEEYSQNYGAIKELLADKKQHDEEFVQFCLMRRQAAKHSLDSLLLLPVHRIAEYDKHLTDLLAGTEETHPDWNDLCKARDRVEKLVRESEPELQHLDNEYKMEKIQERFPHDDLQLLDKEGKAKLAHRRRSAPSAMILKSLGKSKSSPNISGDYAKGNHGDGGGDGQISRMYILEGPVQLTAGLQTQERYMFLFNDLLLVAKQKSSTTYKLKTRVRVGEIWMAECLDEVSELTHDVTCSFVIGWPTMNYVATFSSPELKEKWKEKLTEQVQCEKRRESPSIVSVEIRNKEEKEQQMKTLEVSNSEEALEVVKRCMLAFKHPVEEALDYQLWVVSSKENAPYPLSGHEHPFSIYLSHIRDAAKLTGDEMVLPPEVNLDETYRQCQFILRQKKKSPTRHSIEDPAKRMKKGKKSPIINFFRRPTKASPPVSPTGKLFGHPLENICDGNNLPRVIMDLLQFLFQEGPVQHGIFRRSANFRCVKELREKLDTGQCENLCDQQVIVVGTVFKEFLRSIPGCLLQSSLYDLWEKSTQIPENLDRVTAVNQVVCRLPQCHQQLLRYFICLLHHIDLRSDENGMNARNLAVCTGPSLLWPSSPSQEQVAATMVTSLVQHMIMHCVSIFGEGVTRLLGDPPQKTRQDSSTDSDSMHSMLSMPDGPGMIRQDNSSLDSLDREYDSTEMEVSPKLLKPTMNLSRDSGLTLSDSQLYNEEVTDSENNGARKQSFTRSQSHFEQEAPKTVKPAPVSRSYEFGQGGAPPIPPPRKSRKKISIDERAQGNQCADPNGKSDQSSVSGRETDVVTRETGLSGEQHSHQVLAKRISADSLMSLSENSETSEYGSREDMDFINAAGGDMGVLRKSASGAHLYYNDELVHSSQQGVKVSRVQPKTASPDQSEPVLQNTTTAYGLKCRKANGAGKAMIVPTIHEEPASVHHVASDNNLRESYAGKPSERMVDSFDGSASYGGASLRKEREYTQNDPIVERRSVSTTELPSNYKSRIDPEVVTPRNHTRRRKTAVTMGSPDYGALADADPSMKFGITQEEQVDDDESNTHESPSQVVMRKKRDVLRKGMTARGSDVFPKLRNLYARSLHEDDLSGGTEYESDSGSKASCRLPTYEEHQRRQSLNKVSTDTNTSSVATRSRPKLTRSDQLRRVSLEKSASESCIAYKTYDSVGQPDIAGVDDGDSPLVGGGDRPAYPPSYQEALQRREMLRHGHLSVPITAGDVREQTQKSAQARKLYEQSMQLYQQELSYDPSTEDQNPPSHQHVATNNDTPCVPVSRSRSEHSVKESVSNSATKLTRTGSNNSRPLREQNSPESHDSTPTSSRPGTPVKQNNGSKGDEQSTVRKRRARSRDRPRSLRLSDTRLEDRKNAENVERNVKENDAPRINLNRSKSDSAEMISRVSRFKHIMPVMSDHEPQQVSRTDRINNNHSNHNAAQDVIRARGRSMKNRDWHKELAATYSDIFYQPPEETKLESKVLYVTGESKQAETTTKRRWSRPVHPTKDLAPHVRGPKQEATVRRHSAFIISGTSSDPIEKKITSESDTSNIKRSEPPVNPVRVPASSMAERTAPKPSLNAGDVDDADEGQSEVITWSVAKMRHLYDPARGSSQEKTVPSETAYV